MMKKRVMVLVAMALSGAAFGLRADINGDGRVDLQDLAILASEWLMETEMDYPNKLLVGGSVYPDVRGIYNRTADVNGYPAWQFVLDSYHGAAYESVFRIYSSFAAGAGGPYWLLQCVSSEAPSGWVGQSWFGGSNLIGNYAASGGFFSGTAVVEAYIEVAKKPQSHARRMLLK